MGIDQDVEWADVLRLHAARPSLSRPEMRTLSDGSLDDWTSRSGPLRMDSPAIHSDAVFDFFLKWADSTPMTRGVASTGGVPDA